MYRLKEIQDKLLGVVGWRQAYDVAKQINPDLTTSESGLYFQDAHPLLTLDNVAAIMPDDFYMKYPDWSDVVIYAPGDKVKLLNVVYVAKLPNTGIQPAANTPDWDKYNFLSDYLETQARSGIATALQSFITSKQLDKETRNLLERKTFFQGSGKLAATVDNRGKICGYEIKLIKSLGVTVKIERIGLQMTGGTGVVKLYLFHSGRVDPVKTIELNYSLTNGGFQWFEVSDVYLPFISVDTNSGGYWYLCYNQNELPPGMEAITVSKDWSREPCGGCNVGNIHDWREMSKYMSVSPFKHSAPSDFNQFPELWNEQSNIYTNTINYGINVEFSVGCDLSDFIIAERSIFANVIQKQVAVNILRTIAMNPDVRVNRKQVNVSRMDVLYELDGNTAAERPSGLAFRLSQDYKALSLDTKGIDRVCLGCRNGGIRFKSM